MTSEIMLRGRAVTSSDGTRLSLMNKKLNTLDLKSWVWIKFTKLEGKRVKIVITLEE
jgi:hypothetical protein